MIDNFDLIADIIRERPMTEDEFFFLQVIKRKKDNPDIGMSHSITIHNWYIANADELLEKKDAIIKQCIDNNARAYFRMNKRSYKKVALQTLALIAQNIASGNYSIKNCYESCAGQHHSDVSKTWLLDIDDGEMVLSDEMVEFIKELVAETKRVFVFHKIPTKSGYHIICPPFNIKKFNDRFGKLSYHRDNPTVLYIP